ncbi:MAG: WYL domain-containing protein [bacterium]|nr:WYL domain-containing protein [bacterium]
MSKRLSYERYLWFHRKLKKGRYPKLKELMEHFEISQRQAAREIEHMRLFFNAPVEYSPEHRGYYYSDNSFEFPSAMITEEEIISLIIAKRLSVTIPDKRRQIRLDTFFENLSASFDLDIAQLEKKISLKNIRYYRVSPGVFDAVLQGVNKNKKLHITYRSVHTKEDSRRTVAPLHLMLYMGNWHIIAYCELKKGIRDFTLSRIQGVSVLEEPVEPHLSALNIKEKIDESYGIFFEGSKQKVILKFNERIADFVREQVWFPGQAMREEEPGGHLVMEFYVTDFREVAREVLRLGADVEVVEPGELRTMIKDTAQKLSRMYE